MMPSIVRNPNLMLPVGIDLVRIFCGGIIFTFGLELTDREVMAGYIEWLTDVGMPFPVFMAKLGKVVELAGGLFLLLGLYTRLAALMLILPMAVVTFIMLDGTLTNSSFILLLLFVIYLILGSGKLSLDYWIYKS
jgi:putative oxidoreductase